MVETVASYSQRRQRGSLSHSKRWVNSHTWFTKAIDRRLFESGAYKGPNYFGPKFGTALIFFPPRNLISTKFLADILFSGSTVLVHGGSGKDTTLIVSSFAQVLLDSHCRTVLG